MKEYIKKNKKGLILVSIGLFLLIFSLVMNKNLTKEDLKVSTISYNTDAEVPESKRLLSEDELLDIYINSNIDTFNFYSSMFQLDNSVLVNKIREDYQILDLLNTDNLDKTILFYIEQLEENNSDLFDNKLNVSNPSKDYMVALIKYFTDIYDNVDFSIAAAIAQIESGYTSQHMLNKNNIFGGMSNGGLIKYKNIEYGIYRYIKLLSEGYFGKGLITVEDIGRVYNPTYNENGQKIAKPSWVNNVTIAMENYIETEDDVNIETLMNLKAEQ